MSDEDVKDYGRDLPSAQEAGFVSSSAVRRPCEVCGGELYPDNRKVHAGDCARARDTALQRRRRQRKRIARSGAVA